MTSAGTRLLVDFEREPRWTDPPTPVRAQIGGVARWAAPCPLRYVRRDGRSVP